MNFILPLPLLLKWKKEEAESYSDFINVKKTILFVSFKFYM